MEMKEYREERGEMVREWRKEKRMKRRGVDKGGESDKSG